MISLLDYIKKNNIKTILQTGSPFKEFYSILNEVDPKIWIVVLNKTISRETNRNSFDVVSSTLKEYHPLMKFDIAFINENQIPECKGKAKRVLFRPIRNDFTKYIREPQQLRILTPKLGWLPLGIQKFLSSFDSVLIDETYIVGELI